MGETLDGERPAIRVRCWGVRSPKIFLFIANRSRRFLCRRIQETNVLIDEIGRNLLPEFISETSESFAFDLKRLFDCGLYILGC